MAATVETLATAAPESVDALLTQPRDGATTTQLTRAGVSVTPRHSQFTVKDKDYTKQFCHVYSNRFKVLYDRVAAQAKERWISGENSNGGQEQVTLCRSVLDLKQEQTSVVVGTLFKEMKLRPNLIEEYGKNANAQARVDLASYVGDDNKLFIEDEAGRVLLSGPLVADKISSLVTGVTCAVKGTPQEHGDLLVTDICFSDLAPQLARDTSTASATDTANDKYIALVSGIKAGLSPAQNLRADLAFDYIAGMLGGQVDSELSSKVSRVILAGNSVQSFEKEAMTLKQAIGKGTRGNKDQSVAALQELDVMVAQLASAVPVDIMPGAEDPANYLLPQQPFYRQLLPSAAEFSSTSFTTNPYRAIIDGLDVVGTSGQNVDDIRKYTSGLSALDRLESTMTWQHIAPTCPDTLSAHPFTDTDPFIIKETPHIYFAGNQDKFETSVIKTKRGEQCRTVCVPDFSKTNTIVLVNIKTLECHPVTFDAKMDIDA